MNISPINNKQDILSHLKLLDMEDRYLRFCSNVTDEALEQYVNKIDLLKDSCFGIYDFKNLISFVHVAINKDLNQAEIGISIDKNYRNKGLARQHLMRAFVHCNALGIDTVFMSCLRENRKVQHICKSLNLKVIINADEAFSELSLKERNRSLDVLSEISFNNLVIFDRIFSLIFNKEFI